MISNPITLSEQKHAERESKISYWALAVVFLVVYVGSMFIPGLLDDADSTHAEAAREMVVSGDYVTLHINGVRYLEKAPLPYWLVAFSYKLLGVNEFSTRLPMVLSVMLLGLLAFRWGRRTFGERTGIYAALFTYTCAGVYLFTRVLIPEVLLSLLIAAALYFFLTALEPGAPAWRWYAAYALIALGVLTKGLIALAFPCGAAFFFLLLTGDWRRWREFRLLSGLALFVAIAAPWHILAGLRNPGTPDHHGFLWFYFVNEHFLRFLGKRYPRDYNKLPATLYWSLHLVWLFPWSLYLPAAITVALQEWRSRSKSAEASNQILRSDFASRTRLMCWILASVVLLFFALSTNQEYYTFPAYLPLLLLLADGVARCEWTECLTKERTGWLTTSAGLLAVIGLIASTMLAVGLWQSRNLPFEPDIGALLSKQDTNAYTLSTSHMLDLSYASFAALRLPAGLAAFALLVAPVLSFLLRLYRRHYSATWMLGIGFAIFLIAAHVALGRFGPYLSSKQLAQEISRRAHPEDKVMIYGDQAFGSSLLFYLQRPIDLVEGRTTSMWFGSTFADAPKIYLSNADLQHDWAGTGRVFLFVPPHQKTNVDGLLPTKYVVAELSGKYVYSNQP
ncbi:MAG: family glycosyltransferase, 4-amino-4-deoxy-L-arabinose transferase [Candidatus Sulfotelmatobacter sp.]|nr:family glycosyltransferase, 4-amino-4-deoxy-L-arabinose transferase [Candidatus Sulfotelmatobacter sp.]